MEVNEIPSACEDCLWNQRELRMTKEEYKHLQNSQKNIGSSSSCIVKFPIMVNQSKSTHLSTILMVFLLVNLTNQTVSATPLFRPQQQPQQKLQNNSIFASKPNWHDPCGLKHQGQFRNRHSNPWLEYVTPSDDDLMHNIVNMAKLALRQSRYFKEDYVKKTFHEPSWWDHHERWKDMRYTWLPSWEEVPKHLHESVLLSHLNGLEMVSELQKVFTYLQKIAAGMEQVVVDQAGHNGEFLTEFDRAQFGLKMVLCEIEYALLQKGVPEDDLAEIPREIIPMKIRNLEDQSYRNLRDWYIYRDYMNGLEYVVDAFNHLRRNNGRRRRRRRQTFQW